MSLQVAGEKGLRENELSLFHLIRNHNLDRKGIFAKAWSCGKAYKKVKRANKNSERIEKYLLGRPVKPVFWQFN
jgi:hypothetical protein